MVVAPLSMAFLAYFVMRTRTGRGMQATAQDPDTAKLMGVNTDRIIVIAFALGAAFAAVGGVAYGLKYGQIDFKMGFLLGLKAFTAAVLGGIGNLTGATFGGIMIGLILAMSDRYLEARWTSVIVFSILIIVLIFRPTGLFAEKQSERA